MNWAVNGAPWPFPWGPFTITTPAPHLGSVLTGSWINYNQNARTRCRYRSDPLWAPRNSRETLRDFIFRIRLNVIQTSLFAAKKHALYKQEADLMQTNLRDAFRGQLRSPNIVPFHMSGTVSSCAIVTLSLRQNCLPVIRLQKISRPWNPGQRSLKVIESDTIRQNAYDFL